MFETLYQIISLMDPPPKRGTAFKGEDWRRNRVRKPKKNRKGNRKKPH